MSESIQYKISQLIETHSVLVLSTYSLDKMPQASVAPFVMPEPGVFYVYLSRLAAHCENLLFHPSASLLLFEENADNAFASTRLSYELASEVVVDTDRSYLPILDALQQRHGDTMAVLRSLPDFVLFKLTAKQGRLVTGFAKTYLLEGPAAQNVRLYEKP